MVARAVALFALLAFAAAGCGSRTYTGAEADAAAGGHAQSIITYGNRDFATWAAVTDLELDPEPLYESFAGEVEVRRFATAHDARAALRAGLGWVSFPHVRGRPPNPVLVRRDNLLIFGDRAAVDAALRRLR